MKTDEVIREIAWAKTSRLIVGSEEQIQASNWKLGSFRAEALTFLGVSKGIDMYLNHELMVLILKYGPGDLDYAAAYLPGGFTGHPDNIREAFMEAQTRAKAIRD
jgi:hypothetical protein